MVQRFALTLIGLLALAIPSLVLAQSASSLPQANFSVSPSVGEASSRFMFDASDSVGSNGQNSSLQYRWQFRSGRDYTSFSGSPRATYVPLDDGVFRARLQVRDTRTGQIQTTYRTYRATTGIPRRASIFADPLTPKAGEVVNFRVEVFKVQNEDLDDIEVRWDFDGNGTFDTEFQPQKETSYAFGFTQIQQILPRAEIKFPDGSTVIARGLRPAKGGRFRTPDKLSDFGRISVSAPAVVSPILNVSPGTFATTTNTVFTFDASKSLVPRGGRLEWSFDGGEFETGKQIVKKTFESSGEHTIRVRTCVGFASPECSESKTTIEIKDPPKQFFLNLTVNEASNSDQKLTRVTDQYFQGSEGISVRFSARAQTSSGGAGISNLQYRWDFDGNGKFDTISSKSAITQYQFDKVGRFHTTVEATSPQGVKRSEKVIIDIGQNTFPTGEIQIPSGDLFVGKAISFTPKVSDSETSSGDLEVQFDLNGDNIWDSGFQKNGRATWKYTSPGAYLIRMQVRDGNGKTTIVKKEINVRPDPKLAEFGINQGGASTGNGSTESGADSSDSEPNSDESLEGSSNSNGVGGPGSSGGSLSQYRGRSGEYELRIPLREPELQIHKDYRGYVRYVTGFDPTIPQPEASKPWVVETASGTPPLTGVSVQETNTSDNSGASTNQGSPASEGNTNASSEVGSGAGEGGSAGGNSSQNQASGGTASGATGSSVQNGPQGDLAKVQTKNTESSSSVAKTVSPASKNITLANGKVLNPFLQGIVKRYQGQRIYPAYPGENPFVDISESDPHFLIAIQAYRDGAVKGPRFYWK